jgi:hypothetical protein
MADDMRTMRTRTVLLLAVLVATVGCFTTPARAAFDSEFAVGVGYSHVTFNSGSPLLDDRDCIHLDSFFSGSPFPQLPGLRVGAAVGFSAALDNTRSAFISSGGQTIFISGSDVSLLLFEPELRVAWRHSFGDYNLSYVEAGVAGGGVIAWLSADGQDEAQPKGTTASFDESDVSWSARAFVRLGFPVPDGIVGVEASYLRGGNMKFADGVSGDVEDFYIGVYGALTF